ncbi:DNA adenine methylase [Cupriavidus alkaliphilus]|nr:DNA adenine methylase [Cupriavidus alkaliphilus]
MQMVEPFAGSAALSLNLLARDVIGSIMLFERDPLVFSFWHAVFFETDRLVHLVQAYPPTLETRRELEWLREMDEVHADVALMGYAGLMFNRTSFSGVLHAGPIGGVSQSSAYKVGCRYNAVDLVRRISEISEYRDRVEVYFGDAQDALADACNVDNEGRFFYVDPPYYVQGPRLYRYSYGFAEHHRLASVLAEANYKWFLSYDDHPVIRHFYRDYQIHEPILRYSSKVPKSEAEVFITNVSTDGVIGKASSGRLALPEQNSDETALLA